MSILTKPYFQGLPNNGVRYTPDSTCVLWLPGQDDANSTTIRDRSGYGNNGTIDGATWSKLGTGLSYLDLDGNDFIDCGTDSSLDVTSEDFSFWTWLRADSITSRHIYARIQTLYTSGWRVLFESNDKMYVYTYQAAAAQQTNTAVNPVTIGEWSLVSVARTGTAIRICINGVANIEGAGTHTNPATAAANAYLGKRSDGAEFFDGGLALPRFAKRNISDAEFLDIYRQERPLFGV